MRDERSTWPILQNEAFKLGRRAGHEDVAKEILRYDPSFAWKIAREFLDDKVTDALPEAQKTL